MLRLILAIVLFCAVALPVGAFPTNANTATIDVSALKPDYRDYSFVWGGWSDQKMTFTISNLGEPLTSYLFSWEMTRGTNLYIFKPNADITVGSSTLALGVSYTNVPPVGVYKAEILMYSATPVLQTRTIGRGEITVIESLYANTNLNAYPWPAIGTYTGAITSIQGDQYISVTNSTGPGVLLSIQTGNLITGLDHTNEINARVAADAGLTNSIGVLTTNLTAAGLYATNQATARIGADAALTAAVYSVGLNLTNEIANRVGADAALTTAVYGVGASLTNHINLTGTNAHGLGDAATSTVAYISSLSSGTSTSSLSLIFAPTSEVTRATLAEGVLTTNLTVAGLSYSNHAAATGTNVHGLGTVATLAISGVVTSVVPATGAASNDVTQAGSIVTVHFGGAPMYRYAARTNSGEEINVLATGLGVTAARSGTTVTVTVPAGVRVLSITVRWNGALGVGFNLDMGQVDMANSALTDRWNALFGACREDNGAVIAGASCRLNTTTQSILIIGGLPSDTTAHCRFGF